MNFLHEFLHLLFKGLHALFNLGVFVTVLFCGHLFPPSAKEMVSAVRLDFNYLNVSINVFGRINGPIAKAF